MKILVIGPSDTKSRGGMASVIRDMRSSAILNENDEIHVFASYIDGCMPVRALYCAYAYIKFLFCYRKYDLFHIHSASNNSTFRKLMYLKTIKRAGKKAVVHIHAGQYLTRFHKLPPRKKEKVIRFIQCADMVLTLSKQWKSDFQQTFHGIRCHYLYNGVNEPAFHQSVSDVAKTCHIFLFLGNVQRDKGVYDLVEAVEIAAKENPEILLYIAGSGETESINMKIAEKGLEKNVQVVGWINGEEKLKYLKNVSTVVLPSYHEALPMSILEGMAAGKAIISTTVGAIPEVVTEENGILIQPGDVQALANAMIRCASNPELLQKISNANVRKAKEEFSMECMHRQLLKYYQEIV